MGNKQQKRVHRAIANASDLFIGLSDPSRETDMTLGNEVAQRIGEDAIRYQDERWIVTELGFVTMAVLPRFGVRINDAVIVPGVDDHNTRGHLVLRHGAVPYHSLAGDPERAVREAENASARAARLVEYYGSREALRQAAQSAPWYLRSTASDVRRSGLCTWGVDSWLGRIGVGRLAYRTGLPRLFVQLAGSYGDRITAMTVMRMEQAERTIDIPTGLSASQSSPDARTTVGPGSAVSQHADEPMSQRAPGVSNRSMLTN